MGERLQKVLARHGFGSRREIEGWMRDGRVLLNGKPAGPGDPYQLGDRVRIDGRDVTARLAREVAPAVLIHHKVTGESLDRGAAAGATLLDRLPSVRGARWIPVNRMSPGDSGLALFTTDGRLANALMRAAAKLPAIYMVRVHAPDAAARTALLVKHVVLEGVRVEFDTVEPAGGEGSNRWFKVTAPGADRRSAVRALFESQGFTVSRVIQTRLAEIDLPRDLPRGRHRQLPSAAVTALYERVGLAPPDVASLSGKHRSGAPLRRVKPARKGRAGPVRSRSHKT